MRIEATYLNERIEMFDGVLGSTRQSELETLSFLYNRYLGPVRSLNLHRPNLLDFSMYSASCGHTRVDGLMPDLAVRPNGSDNLLVPAGGKGMNLTQPILGALGEIGERLLTVLHFQNVVDDLVWATYAELVRHGHRALGPEELFLFAAEQYDQQRFPFVPFHPTTQLRWIKGKDLLTGEAVFAPAQLVLLYYKHAVGEARIGYPTSGGLAFHADRRKAILHGLYEFIERDAINVCWFCRLAPPRIDVDVKRQLMRQGNSRHVRISTPAIETVQIFLNSLDIRVPVITAVAFDRSCGDHSFLGGGGAAGNSETALTQALFELGQTRVVLRSLGPSRIRRGSGLKDMTDFLDATVYYGFESNRSLLEWYTSSAVTVPWASLPDLTAIGKEDEYDVTLRYARSVGLKPIVFDFSDTCWPGATLVRVIVPQLTMACVPAYPYLGHPRYYEVPQKLGFADRRLSFRDMNVDPLPFP